MAPYILNQNPYVPNIPIYPNFNYQDPFTINKPFINYPYVINKNYITTNNITDFNKAAEIFEDVLPTRFALTHKIFNTIANRLELSDYIKSLFVRKDNEEIEMSHIRNKNNRTSNNLVNILSKIKIDTFNPYNNRDSDLYRNLEYCVMYKSSYPIKLNDTNTIVSANSSINMNVRIYKKFIINTNETVSDYDNKLKYKYNNRCENLKYWYNTIKNIINLNISPNFILMYTYYQANNIGIEYKQLSDIDINDNTDHNYIFLTESPNITLNKWVDSIYSQTNKNISNYIQVNNSYHSSFENNSILFQFIISFIVMVEKNILYDEFSIENLHIKYLENKQGELLGYWKYIVNNVEYKVENYGYLLTIDANINDDITFINLNNYNIIIDKLLKLVNILNNNLNHNIINDKFISYINGIKTNIEEYIILKNKNLLETGSITINNIPSSLQYINDELNIIFTEITTTNQTIDIKNYIDNKIYNKSYDIIHNKIKNDIQNNNQNNSLNNFDNFINENYKSYETKILIIKNKINEVLTNDNYKANIINLLFEVLNIKKLKDSFLIELFQNIENKIRSSNIYGLNSNEIKTDCIDNINEIKNEMNTDNKILQKLNNLNNKIYKQFINTLKKIPLMFSTFHSNLYLNHRIGTVLTDIEITNLIPYTLQSQYKISKSNLLAYKIPVNPSNNNNPDKIYQFCIFLEEISPNIIKVLISDKILLKIDKNEPLIEKELPNTELYYYTGNLEENYCTNTSHIETYII